MLSFVTSGAGAFAGLVLFGLFGSVAPVATEEYAAERIEPAAGEPALPKEIPEPFAKLLDPAGLRLLERDGETKKPLCELWLRAEVPLIAKAAPPMNVEQGRLAPGVFVGVLRALRETTDYRDQSIEPGVYALRYFHQPSDGNHLGTSDSRDFLILTSFEHDRDPAPIAEQEALVAAGVPVSPSDHVLTLYLAAAPPDPPKDSAPRVFKRGEKSEWALELVLRGKAPDAPAAETLRLGLVLVGHTAG